MKTKTKIKIRYALRAHKTLFLHPFARFMVKDKEVNIYQFIAYGWHMIDIVFKG